MTYMKDAISVDINAFTAFTEDHLNTYKSLIVHKAHPWLFGEDLLPALKVASTEAIVNVSDINYQEILTGQTVRVGGKNPKFKQISQDILNFGFKLTNPAICLFRKPDGSLILINGRTRFEILVHQLKFTNVICIIFEGRDGFTEDQIENDCSQFGLLSNSYSDPAGDLQIEDVYREVQLAIKNGWIEDTIQDITERVNRVCGKGCFAPSKKDELVYRILNTHNPNFIVRSWTGKGSAQQWMKENGYKNIKPQYQNDDKGKKVCVKRGIMYLVVSSSMGSKTIIEAASTARENPDYDIRIVIHTGTLTGFDLEKCWEDRVIGFRDFYDSSLDEVSFGFFNDTKYTKSPISLFGAVPSVGTYFVEDPKCEKLVRFVPKTLMNDMKGLEI